MRLGGKVFEEQGIHGALEADVKLGDLALVKRDDLHAREAEMLEQGRHVGLIAAHAVQRLGQHHIELAALGVLQERLHARPQDHAGAGDGGVMVGADDFPLLPRRMLAADAELVLDRGDALIVGRIAGVEGNPGHRVVSVVSRRIVSAGHCHSPHSAARTLPAPSAGRSIGRSAIPSR